ncbi:uncharacterized protein LOC122849454 [Aphidius gifuensis]|uniref:uncharacterized protein LOC122849454 n=1 Tax=Aphidius gifuensis TaxID=684658 RepID=UPI001CDB5D61|nr:uncharacterized protein LOC122849454 [Aphidius gifuensis]
MSEIKILSGSEFKKIFTTNYEDSTPSSGEKDNKINHHDDDLELEKISVKRCADEISFDKKSDKICYHNDDHSYAKNIITDCVNDDCLVEIFMYLPIYERPKIALVCKKWQRVLDGCWFDIKKKLELIYWNYDEYPSYLKKFPTIDRELSFLNTLLDKCGCRLTKLDLTDYCHCNIVPIINESCPNLVQLRLRFSDVDDAILYNSFSRLSKLQKLTIIFQFFNDECIPASLINSLRNVAGTLTDLNLLIWMYGQMGYQKIPEEATCVIPELKALKIFGVAGITIPQALCDYLTNNEIFFFSYYHYYRYKRDHDFNINKDLDLSQFRVTDDSLYIIANVKMYLQVLYVFCEWITDDGVVAISKMNELHTLEFIGCNKVTDSSIKLLKNLRKLKLPSSSEITDYSVMKVLENSPNMEELYIEDTGVTIEFIKKAADISENRKRLLRLFYSSDTFIPDVKQYKSQYFDIRIIQEKKQNITASADVNCMFIENIKAHFS